MNITLSTDTLQLIKEARKKRAYFAHWDAKKPDWDEDSRWHYQDEAEQAEKLANRAIAQDVLRQIPKEN